MPSKNKKGAFAGSITFHTPVAASVLTSSSRGHDWKSLSVSVSESRKPSYLRIPGPEACVGKRRAAADWLSHSSLRQLQATLQIENSEAKSITQNLFDTENGFIKELDSYLSHMETLELRRKTLLHKRWVKCVWAPIEEKIKEHGWRDCLREAKRRRAALTSYINYCNAKGFVFLEDYDPLEYDPFQQYTNRPNHLKVSTPALEDPLLLQSRGRMKEKRILTRCQTGLACTRKQIEEQSCLSGADGRPRIPSAIEPLKENTSNTRTPNRRLKRLCQTASERKGPESFYCF